MSPRTLLLWLAAGCGIAASAWADDAATLDAGKTTFQYWCATCHGGSASYLGKNSLPGTLALSLKYKGQKPALLEDRTDLTKELVKYVVRHGIQAMPNFRKTEIDDAELDALAAYLARNSK